MGADIRLVLRVVMTDELLPRLAILGDVFDIALASAFAGMPSADLLEHLDAAEGDRVLTVQASTISFDRDRRAELLASLGVRDRALAHARAAAVLEQERPHDLRGIAIQRAGAVAILGLGPVLEAFASATEQALRIYDWDAADPLLAHAVEVAANQSGERADILRLQRARVQYLAGRFAEAIAQCRMVARTAQARGDLLLLAECALVVRGISDRDICAELLGMCRTALAGLVGNDALRARLLAQQAMLQSELDRRPADLILVSDALKLAEASGDARAIIEALHAVQMAKSGARQVGERMLLADRLEGIAEESGLVEYLVWPLSWRVDALFQLGHRPELDAAISRLEEYGLHRNHALAAWKARMALAVIAQVEGQWADAEQLGLEAVEIARAGGHDMAEFIYRILISQCRAATVAGEPADVTMDSVALGGQAMAAFPAMQAATRDDMETAMVFFDRALPFMDALAGHDLEVPTYIALAVAAWALDRADAAPALRAALAPFADEMGLSATGQAASMGSVSRFLGQMAALKGAWEEMEEDFSRAMRRSMEFGDRPCVAETRYDWARALIHRGQARDRERARALLEAAARDADALGMRPLQRRVERLRQDINARYSLSTRETEIAGLVAEGLSNKEIASRLRLSIRTVENHALNIMNKLGLDNRTQMAAWMTRIQATREQSSTR
jgi:DNA-binding CsgD family transcriptional regulator